MKRKAHRVIALLACACLLAVSRCACGRAETVDYAASVAPDAQGETVRQEVTVSAYVDGDTTHFNVPTSIDPSGVLKARYIAVNAPESTGVIAEWGKKATAFTREKLESADSIVIESDDGRWNPDSTGDRYLVWVWYRPAGEAAYRNLNIELLQNGLALANSAAQTRYGETCVAAAMQAQAEKLHIHSGQKDPDFYYGSAIELTIKELRLHPEAYDGKKVAFTGIVTGNHNNSVFVEDYDGETGLYFGISVYYGFNLSGGGLEALHVGNEARIVGTMQYYEAGHAWQVTNLKYRMMKPKDPGNVQMLSAGHAPSWKETAPEDLYRAVTVATEEGMQGPFAYADLAQATSVSLFNLRVSETRLSEDGALLSALCGGDTAYPAFVRMRAPETHLTGKTIDIRGIVQADGNGPYIRVYTSDGLTIHND